MWVFSWDTGVSVFGVHLRTLFSHTTTSWMGMIVNRFLSNHHYICRVHPIYLSLSKIKRPRPFILHYYTTDSKKDFSCVSSRNIALNRVCERPEEELQHKIDMKSCKGREKNHEQKWEPNITKCQTMLAEDLGIERVRMLVFDWLKTTQMIWWRVVLRQLWWVIFLTFFWYFSTNFFVFDGNGKKKIWQNDTHTHIKITKLDSVYFCSKIVSTRTIIQMCVLSIVRM